MNVTAPPPTEALAEKAAIAARLLRLLAHDKRLLVLCELATQGEVPVGRLVEVTGLSQPALSQQLALLRAEGLVTTRRAAQTIHYRLADPKVMRLLETLHELYCATPP